MADGLVSLKKKYDEESAKAAENGETLPPFEQWVKKIPAEVPSLNEIVKIAKK